MPVSANIEAIDVIGWTTINPVITASMAYSAGNSIGGLLTLTNLLRSPGGAVILNDVLAVDKANQKAQMSLLFFGSLPTGTYADFASPALLPDLPKLIGEVPVPAADFITLGSDSAALAQEKNLNLILPNTEAGRNLYMLILTSGTPTYGHTTDLQLLLKFSQVF